MCIYSVSMDASNPCSARVPIPPEVSEQWRPAPGSADICETDYGAAGEPLDWSAEGTEGHTIQDSST